MRAVVQRVREASVEVAGEIVGAIEHGLLVYLGVGKRDDDAAVTWMAHKVETLRIFEDEAGKMNRAVREVLGSVLVVSQFTLFGDVRKSRRPGFDDAAPAADAQRLYELFCATLSARDLTVARGRFRADMQVRANVDGPVTILVDSERTF